jgi:hypothetical protein
MTVIYKLVGYDRKTERQSVKIDIPAQHVDSVKSIAGVAPHDVADYPLDKNQVRGIVELIGKPFGEDSLDYFLEPYVQPARRRSA